MMNMPGTDSQFLQSRFALDSAKAYSLEQKLQSRENRTELMKAAKQFEGVFIKMVMAEMDKTIDRSDFLSGGQAEEMFRGMLYDNIAEQMATRPSGSGLGLAEAIYKEMSKNLPPEESDTTSVKEGPTGDNSHD